MFERQNPVSAEKAAAVQAVGRSLRAMLAADGSSGCTSTNLEAGEGVGLHPLAIHQQRSLAQCRDGGLQCGGTGARRSSAANKAK
jgi:hypothetical protein